MDIKHEIKLMNFIEANLNRPFAWGECDCNTFTLEMIDAVYELALAEKIKGKYENELGAIRFRMRSEWGSFINLIKEAGFIEGKRDFEQTGDLLIVEDPGKWEMVHIYLGNTAVSSFPGEGVRVFPMALMKDKQYTVWRLPCLPQ